MKFSGTKQAVAEQIKLAREVAKRKGAESFEASSNAAQNDSLWSARKTALWSFLAMKRHPDDKFIACDVAVPISRLADIVEDTKRRMNQSGLLGHTLGHVGDGTSSPGAFSVKDLYSLWGSLYGMFVKLSLKSTCGLPRLRCLNKSGEDTLVIAPMLELWSSK